MIFKCLSVMLRAAVAGGNRCDQAYHGSTKGSTCTFCLRYKDCSGISMSFRRRLNNAARCDGWEIEYGASPRPEYGGIPAALGGTCDRRVKCSSKTALWCGSSTAGSNQALWCCLYLRRRRG